MPDADVFFQDRSIPEVFTRLRDGQLPPIGFAIEPITVQLGGPISISGDPFRPLPIDVCLGFKPIEVRIPATFRVGVSVFGIEITSIVIAGEAKGIIDPDKTPCVPFTIG